MNLKHVLYVSIILIFSCTKPTLIGDKDCLGIIDGDAIVDECGVCDGPGKTGCDNKCGSTIQIDCEGECGGTAQNDCCNGCQSSENCLQDDCLDICGGFSHLEYLCQDSDSSEILLDLSTRTLTCLDEFSEGNCNPKTSSCLFVNCGIDTMYNNTVINCQGSLPNCQNGECDQYTEYPGDEYCDYLDTNCEEFNFDSDDEGNDDCNLIDCNGIHFSEELCERVYGSSCTMGDSSWLGDGGCDKGEDVDEILPLNFNCEKWGFDGAECICKDIENNEYDCWEEPTLGNYVCPGEVKGGDCLTSSGRTKNIHNVNLDFQSNHTP